MRISDWSSDVCSSDLLPQLWRLRAPTPGRVTPGRESGIHLRPARQACRRSFAAQHLAPKDCVHASLIALALGFEPSKHIGVEPRRYLLLDRLIEPSTLGGLPEILCQRRGITIVDTAIRHRLPGIQLGLLCLGQGGQIVRIELEADGISV